MSTKRTASSPKRRVCARATSLATNAGKLAVEHLRLGERPREGRLARAAHAGEPDDQSVLSRGFDAGEPMWASVHRSVQPNENSFSFGGAIRKRFSSGIAAAATHVTNVLEDGRIPQFEPPNWETLNTFRTQAQIGAGGGVCKPPAG